MALLGEKLLKELPDDARVIACRFPFPNWPQQSSVGSGLDKTFAYDMGSVRSHLEKVPSTVWWIHHFFIIFLRPEFSKGTPNKDMQIKPVIMGNLWCIGNMSVSTDHEHPFERHLWTLQEWERLWLRSMSGWFCHHLAPAVFIQSFCCQNRLSLDHIAVSLPEIMTAAVAPHYKWLPHYTWILINLFSSMTQKGFRGPCFF